MASSNKPIIVDHSLEELAREARRKVVASSVAASSKHNLLASKAQAVAPSLEVTAAALLHSHHQEHKQADSSQKKACSQIQEVPAPVHQPPADSLVATNLRTRTVAPPSSVDKTNKRRVRVCSEQVIRINNNSLDKQHHFLGEVDRNPPHRRHFCRRTNHRFLRNNNNHRISRHFLAGLGSHSFRSRVPYSDRILKAPSPKTRSSEVNRPQINSKPQARACSVVPKPSRPAPAVVDSLAGSSKIQEVVSSADKLKSNRTPEDFSAATKQAAVSSTIINRTSSAQALGLAHSVKVGLSSLNPSSKLIHNRRDSYSQASSSSKWVSSSSRLNNQVS